MFIKILGRLVLSAHELCDAEVMKLMVTKE